MSNPIDCAAALLPKIEIENQSHSMTNAWLKLVNEKTFDTFKDKSDVGGGAKAGLPIKGIPFEFSGFFNGSWDEFQEKRREHLLLESNTSNENFALATFRQSLTDKQLDAWLECVGLNSVGAFLTLANDSEAFVNATLRYRGVPGTSFEFVIKLIGGTYEGASSFTRKIPHDGEFPFTVLRTKPPLTVVIDAYSSLSGLSDSAISIWPAPIKERQVTFGAINANGYSVGINITDDRETTARLFVRAIDQNRPTRFYIPTGAAPGGLSPTCTLFMNYSSAHDREISVDVFVDEENAKDVAPKHKIKLRKTGEHSGWSTRESVAIGRYAVTDAGRNYIVIAADAGELPLINGFWFSGS